MASVNPEAGAHLIRQRLREEHARHEEGARLGQRRDALAVELVAVVDDVDPGLHRHQEGPLVGDVPADEPAALVGSVDRGGELVAGHLHLLARRQDPVAAGDEQLDDVGAPLDLVPDGLPDLVGAVDAADRAPRAELPVPGRVVVGVAGRRHVAAAGEEPRSGNQAVVDRPLEGGVDVVGRARAHRAGEAAAQRGLGVPGSHQRLVRRWLLEPEGSRLRAKVVVRGMEVARHHARHERAPGEVDDPVVGPRGDAAVPHRGDPVPVHDDGRARTGRVLAIEQVGAGENQTLHRSPCLQGRLLHTPGAIQAGPYCSTPGDWAILDGVPSGLARAGAVT